MLRGGSKEMHKRMLNESVRTVGSLLIPKSSLCRSNDGVRDHIPYRKVGHLPHFDFDEIVEWTKDKEK
jgi:hypothetical protein